MRAELAARAAQDGNTIRVTILAPGVVTTELRNSITDEETAREVGTYYDSIQDPLTSDDIAQAILGALETPPHVSINEILVRPTSQPR